jgi:hypothetical protein
VRSNGLCKIMLINERILSETVQKQIRARRETCP